MLMPEQQNIEWKESWRDEYLKWICGFANAQGGKLYIGCDDNGDIVGVDNSKKLLEDIPNKVRDAMGIIVGVNLLTEGGKEYIEIDVPSFIFGRNLLQGSISLSERKHKTGSDRSRPGSFPVEKAWSNLG